MLKNIVGRVVNAIIEGSHDNPEELCGEKSFMYYIHAQKNSEAVSRKGNIKEKLAIVVECTHVLSDIMFLEVGRWSYRIKL